MRGESAEARVAVVREAAAAFAGGRFDVLDRIWHPEIEFDMRPVGIPGVGVYHGREAARQWLVEEWMKSFESFDSELVEVVPVGERSVFVVAAQRGQAPASEAEVAMRYAQICTIEDGLFRRVVNYTDIDEARRAAETAP